ncbi:MAG: helix-turn-helix domain-containing protein [Bacillota bacterium]|nr:MAG: helix-turn-helix domain-containing protein [Bacillota bacterium]
MGRKYRYIGPVERAEIERLHNGGGSPAFIAERVGVHVSAIYRELPKGYTGAVDEYGRKIYSAEAAQQVFERNIKRRGERAAAQ